ncbi:hypothetical protein, partial [Clostridioides difficile]|uniref:hypothetical protein n=1 Tax=Clostridioides difficile TaxID=1496 RepID=UPI003F8D092E
FDITHFEAISNEELKVIEEKVNNVILSSLDIKCDIMNIKEAKGFSMIFLRHCSGEDSSAIIL